ncbi:MAG: 30S ribosomal protein S9 [Abditibacteriales bacterium]|nr:30S ribosomal protein S9 [Abditibacteriales bacterium]MDW8367946.1 30S ribosomal protein S9 [Abditibacteriales bacterium]
MVEAIRYYGTGHRKNAVARVWLQPGEGKITINRRPLEDYVPRPALQRSVREPFEVANIKVPLDVIATARGGGITGQAEAVRHGIAKALAEMNPDLRPLLRRTGLLTRDPRVKERKKYGHKRARRGFQFSKR